MNQDETCRGGRPRPRPHCVRWGPSSPSPKEADPQLSADVCCGQTVRWIKMPLGTDAGLGPGDIVLDGDPAPFPKGHSPQFSALVCCGHTAGWMKMPLGMEVGLGPAHCVRLEPNTHLPSFRPMPIVVKRSPISATAEYLLFLVSSLLFFVWFRAAD